MSSFLGSATSIANINSKSSASGVILDLVFSECCLLLQNLDIVSKLFSTISTLPIIGFTFQQPSRVEFLNYQYAEYPYLNKNVVANAFLKQPTSIQIRGLRAITRGNGVITNYATNYALRTFIETYCDKGGLWTLNTMWGIITNLALTSLSGEPTEQGMGGVVWNFEFKRLLFSDSTTTDSKLSNTLKQAQGGIL